MYLVRYVFQCVTSSVCFHRYIFKTFQMWYPDLEDNAKEQLPLNHFVSQIENCQVAFSVRQNAFFRNVAIQWIYGSWSMCGYVLGSNWVVRVFMHEHVIILVRFDEQSFQHTHLYSSLQLCVLSTMCTNLQPVSITAHIFTDTFL